LARATRSAAPPGAARPRGAAGALVATAAGLVPPRGLPLRELAAAFRSVFLRPRGGRAATPNDSRS